MNLNAQRGAILYRNTAPAATQTPARALNSREQAGTVLYKGSNSAHVGSIDNAVASAFDRIESGVLDDKERLAQVQHDRRTAKSLLEKANAAPSDAHTLLSTYHEARSLNRSKEANENIWQGPHGFDLLRRESGSTEAAEKKIAQTEKLLKRIGKDNPGFEHDLRASGVGTNVKFIQTSAKIIESLSKPKEQAT